MKLTVAIIVAALAVLLGPVVWQFATYKPQSVPSSGLPWQIETLPGGEAQVFGLTLGRSTLADARARFGTEMQLAVIAEPGEDGNVEGYYESVTAGFVAGKLIVTAELSPELIAGMRERAPKTQYMQSTTRRATLAPADEAAALAAPIRGLAFIPGAQLDEAVILERFGQPAERIRAQVISGIRHDARDPDAIAGRLFAETLFPGHAYGRPSDGTEKSVAAIDRDDLKLFRTAAFGRDRLVIAVVGAIDAATLGPLLDKTFGDLPKTAAPLEIADAVPVSGAKASATLAIPQTIIRFGGPGLKRDDPDFMAAYVMNHILGGGSFSSRLYQEIREKRGLTYGVGTYLTPYDHAGLFVGGLGTSADKADEAIALIRQELTRMAADGPTEKELADAKAYLTGSYALRFDTSSKIARQLLAIQLDRLGIDYVRTRNAQINAVTLDQVKAAARRILDAGAPTIVTVGPAAG